MGYNICYSPYFEIYSYSLLVSGLVLVVAACYTLRKIYYGSKSTFAFGIISFTAFLGLIQLTHFVLNLIMKKQLTNEGAKTFCIYKILSQPTSEEKQVFKAYEYVNSLYYLMALQPWVFAMRYLESTINMQTQRRCVKVLIGLLRWTIIVVYCYIIVSALCKMIYYNEFQ